MRTRRERTAWWMVVLVMCAGLAAPARAITTTEIEDTLVNADGSKIEGSVTISWKAFTASDGMTLPRSAITVSIVQGVLKVSLTPNENATPTGTSYSVTYLLNNGSRSYETWVVPASSTPVTVSQIRVAIVPVAGTVIGQSQVSGLVAELNRKADKDLENTFTARQVIEESSPSSTNALLSFQEAGGATRSASGCRR